MMAHRALRVEMLTSELMHVYMTTDLVLSEHAQHYISSIEVSKQEATEKWLQSRSKEEQDQYMRINGIKLKPLI